MRHYLRRGLLIISLWLFNSKFFHSRFRSFLNLDLNSNSSCGFGQHLTAITYFFFSLRRHGLILLLLLLLLMQSLLLTHVLLLLLLLLLLLSPLLHLLHAHHSLTMHHLLISHHNHVLLLRSHPPHHRIIHHVIELVLSLRWISTHHGCLVGVDVLVRTRSKGILFMIRVVASRSHGLKATLFFVVKIVNTRTASLVHGRHGIGHQVWIRNDVFQASKASWSSRIGGSHLIGVGRTGRQWLLADVLSLRSSWFLQWIFPWSTSFPFWWIALSVKSSKKVLGVRILSLERVLWSTHHLMGAHGRRLVRPSSHGRTSRIAARIAHSLLLLLQHLLMHLHFRSGFGKGVRRYPWAWPTPHMWWHAIGLFGTSGSH